MVVVDGQPELLEVVLAGGPGGRLADLLHRGQQQPDEHGDDGDDDQQFDQRERGPGPGTNHDTTSGSEMKPGSDAGGRGDPPSGGGESLRMRIMAGSSGRLGEAGQRDWQFGPPSVTAWRHC